MHCGMLEDPNALWDAGGPHGTVGCRRTKIDAECPQNAFGGWVGVPSTPPSPPLTPLPCAPPTPRDWCLSRQLWWGHRVPAYKVGLSPPGSDPPDAGLWVVARSEDEARDEAARLCCAPPGDVELQQGGGGGVQNPRFILPTSPREAPHSCFPP